MPAKTTKKKSAGKKRGTQKRFSTQALNKYADEVWQQINRQVDESVNQANLRATKFALSVIDFQQGTFDRAFKMISNVQKRSENVLNDHLKKAEWMPDEGKQVVREWSDMLGDGRAEFQKTVDKSFDLLTTYFERLQKDIAAKSPKKKKTAKKKAAPRKKVEAAKKRAGGTTKKKTAAKKKTTAAKKKTTAKKKTAAKKKTTSTES